MKKLIVSLLLFAGAAMFVSPAAVAATPLAISTASLPVAVIEQPYSTTMRAAGGSGAIRWSISAGGLPTGLSLSSSGLISGTTTYYTGAGSNWSVSLRATDASGKSVTAAYKVRVVVKLGDVSSTAIATSGQPFRQALSIDGGFSPSKWTLISGGLPAGLTLSSTGVLSGTPTATVLEDWSATLRVVDGVGQVSTGPLSVRVLPPSSQTAITTTSLPGGEVGRAYSAGLAARGDFATAPLWRIIAGGVPDGLSLNTTTGLISGSPTRVGTWKVTIGLVDQTTQRVVPGVALSIKIVNAQGSVPAASISDVQFPSTASVGSSYGASFFASADPSSRVTVTGLPSGLTMTDVSTLTLAQQVAGKPTGTTGVYPVTITVASGSSQTSQTISITVVSQSTTSPLTLTTPDLGTIKLGQTAFFRLVATGGTGQYVFHGDEGTGANIVTSITTAGVWTVAAPDPDDATLVGFYDIPYYITDGVTVIRGDRSIEVVA